MDRCNPTILVEPGYENLAQFLASQQVQIVASMPCYQEENVDGQRGKGVYGRSIEGLKRLNALGYGQPDSGLTLNLVYNPDAPILPPPQQELTADYKDALATEHGIVFNDYFARELESLRALADDALIRVDGEGIDILDRGRLLLRPIAMVFDAYLKQRETPARFSRVI